jgi:hypothetical protein
VPQILNAFALALPTDVVMDPVNAWRAMRVQEGEMKEMRVPQLNSIARQDYFVVPVVSVQEHQVVIWFATPPHHLAVLVLALEEVIPSPAHRPTKSEEISATLYAPTIHHVILATLWNAVLAR